jgi:acetyl esterase
LDATFYKGPNGALGAVNCIVEGVLSFGDRLLPRLAAVSFASEQRHTDQQVVTMNRLLFGLGAGMFSVAAIAFAFWQFTPWPTTMYHRRGAVEQGRALARSLEKYVPAGVAGQLNLQYETGDADATLDVFYPAAVEQAHDLLPVVVWVHGGEWIYGSKDDIANYLKILASRGFVTVGVNYTVAPARTYPSPVRQINEALAYVNRNAAKLHVDPSQLFLAGDSAGAQIAAQVANVITLPSYAKQVGVVPSIARSQVRGVILHCGMYEVKLAQFGRRGVLWAYFGTKDFMNDPRIEQFSVARSITADFPPIFVSSGNDDALAPQSRLLAATAIKNGVLVDQLIFPEDYKPPVPHEFQYNLDTDEAKLALERSVKFIFARLNKSENM